MRKDNDDGNVDNDNVDDNNRHSSQPLSHTKDYTSFFFF